MIANNGLLKVSGLYIDKILSNVAHKSISLQVSKKNNTKHEYKITRKGTRLYIYIKKHHDWQLQLDRLISWLDKEIYLVGIGIVSCMRFDTFIFSFQSFHTILIHQYIRHFCACTHTQRLNNMQLGSKDDINYQV